MSSLTKIVRVHCCFGSWGFSGSGTHQLWFTIAVDCGAFPEVACAGHSLPFPQVAVNPYKGAFKHRRLFHYHHAHCCHTAWAQYFAIPSLVAVIWCECNPSSSLYSSLSYSVSVILCPHLSPSYGASTEEVALGNDPKSLHATVLMQTVYNAVIWHSGRFLKCVAISVTEKRRITVA